MLPFAFRPLVKSMSAADFIIGVLIEPLNCVTYMSLFSGKQLKSGYLPSLVKTAQVISFLTNNTSFLTVAALLIRWQFNCGLQATVVQDQAYKKENLSCNFDYLAVFSDVRAANSNKHPRQNATYDRPPYQYDNYFHSIIIFIHISGNFLLSAQKKSHLGRTGIQTNHDRRVLTVIFLLVLTASLTGFPSFIFWYLYHYCKPCLTSKSFYFSFEIVQNIFYVKFATDPFLYAWRLTRYRKSLSVVLFCNSRTNYVARESRRFRGTRDTYIVRGPAGTPSANMWDK